MPPARDSDTLHARDLRCVLSRGSQRSQSLFCVAIDGQPPADICSVDIAINGVGVLAELRLYRLIRQPRAILDRTL